MGEEGIELIMEPGDNEMEFEQVPPMEEEKEQPEKKSRGRKAKKEEEVEEDGLVNCLRKELVNVKLVIRGTDKISDKRHPHYGGKADGTIDVYTVPKLRNGELKNPLTTAEKDFLEDYMGLEPNALSVHKKPSENFWINRQVIVQKEGTVLDLSTPMGYINYKILLMNTDLICPSLEELKLMPKATYRYVLVSDKEQYTANVEKVTTTSKCWKEYLKYENKRDVLESLLETLEGIRPSAEYQLEFIQQKVTDYIESSPREFYNAITDPLLTFKVLINTAVERSIVERRGDFYYYNNTPLCGKNENPTITVAAKYISNPRNQEILFSIQGKLR